MQVKSIGITSVIFPPDIGGPATYLFNLSRKLSEKGYKVKVFAWGEEDEIKVENQGQIIVKRFNRKRPLVLRYFLS
ncbi:MAG TPA: hypothetical protein ENG13_01955, partial [bacterium]|nr:hypothetical protein [bacterium]HEX67813.1 hypothetical protein [bacterium]